MSAEGFGSFFVSDDGTETPAPAQAEPVEVAAQPSVTPAAPVAAPAPAAAPQAAPPVQPAPVPQPVASPAPQPAPTVAAAESLPSAYTLIPAAPEPEPQPVAAPVAGPAAVVSREERLAAALDHLMADSLEIEASALVSLDGFTMASALPEAMQEDRVGAMSAAILGLGERAAAELGRGRLSQVFIEGEGGFVLLMAAGEGAVLTCLAGPDAKLGLVIYDMKSAAERIAEILA